MKIDIKLSKNFVTQYNKLQGQFGTDIARINGFDDAQLSYTDFIDNFIDEKTVANVSIDGNSNVRRKDIVTLLSEMPKPHRKLLAFNKIYYEIQKKYGFKTANEWLRAEWIGELYLHDSDTSTFKHYCYKPEEMLTIKYKNNIYNITFQKLYSLIEEEEEYDISIKQMVKYPKDLLVYDYDINTNEKILTKITRIVKHTNDKPMRFLKFANGLSQIVTEDHPVITEDGDKPALEVSLEDKVFTLEPEYFDETSSQTEIVNEKGIFKLTSDLGWVTGLTLAEGNAMPSEVVIAQKTGTPIHNKLISILQKYQIPYTINGDRKTYLKVCAFEKWLEEITKGKTSATKSLPINYLSYPHEFLDGVVAGVIDGDGTIDGYKNRHCQIRITSEELIHQLSNYLQYRGIFCGDRTPHIYKSHNSFEQKLPLFGIGFTLTDEEYFLNIGCYKINTKYEPRTRKGNFANKKYNYSYGYVAVIENTEYIDKCDIVYDITTETGHFICNNVLSHNCFAYDLKDLAERGLYFIGNPFNSKPAKHLTTFVDFVKEFIGFASNRSSGAVGLPNLIPYMFYFWNKDKQANYLGIKTSNSTESYARQNFQRFIYAVNQPYVRDGQQSAFTNTSIFDKPYFEALFGGAEFPDGTFMIDYEDEIIDFQKWYMEEMARTRQENMFTFPVNTISLLYQNKEFVDPEFAEWAIRHNMKWSDSNIFIDDSINSLSNCCRLKSDIRDLGYFNSIGGTALKVGSVKVSTINLARLALDTNSEEEYLKELERRTVLDLKVLDVVRNIIKRDVEKELLPNFTYGLVDFGHLYNTIGFIGIYETMKRFGYVKKDEFGNNFYTDEASIFGEKIFKVMRRVADEFINYYNCDYMINTEQIPGETAAAKLMKKDCFFYPNANIYDLPLYGNQFIPLGIKTTLQERIRVQALFDSFCNGGSILHANIDAPFDSYEKAYKMVKYIADAGVTYFAFNTKIQTCEENHAFYGMTCPVCGKPVETEYTRVVGFYTPINTWSTSRVKEYKMRRWEQINKTAEEIN